MRDAQTGPAVPGETSRTTAFVRRNWGKECALLSAAFEEPICTADDMLTIVRGLSSRIDAECDVNARLYIDDLRVTPRHPLERAFLATEADETLASYIDTVTRRLRGREFCMVIDDAVLFNQTVWHRMRHLAAEIAACAGFPTGRIEYNAFLGTCSTTPFGIHRDKAHTFTVLAGSQTKTMLTWAPGALTSVHGSRLTKDAARIEELAHEAGCWHLGSSADLLYMPAGFWHISRKDRDCRFQASLALGFAMEDTPAADLSDLIARELQTALTKRLSSLGLDRQRAGHAAVDGQLDPVVALSTQDTIALGMAREALSASGEVMDIVEDALRLRTLRRLSGLVESTHTRDLEPVFPSREAGCPLMPDSRVRLRTKVFRGMIGGRLVLAINGSSFTPPPAPIAPFLDAIFMLETGNALPAADLLALGGGIARFIAFAWACDALDINGSSK